MEMEKQQKKYVSIYQNFKKGDGMMEKNSQVILWGAGACGRYIMNYCQHHNIEVVAFGDRDISKIGQKLLEVPVLSIKELKKLDSNTPIIISIQKDNVLKIREELIKEGIENDIFALNDLFSLDGIEGRRNICADFHFDYMDSYYKSSENTVDKFWKDDSLFRKMFNQLDTSYIVELACGRGRHVPQYVEMAKQIVLVDILEKNISYCKERFKDYGHLQYIVNTGDNFKPLKDNTYTAIFSYDSMVHFESIDIYNYLMDTKRILINGGMALYHHSNNHSDYRTSFITGENGRNYMSMDLFAHFADRSGLEVVEQQVIKWGNVEDGITLLRKK